MRFGLNRRVHILWLSWQDLLGARPLRGTRRTAHRERGRDPSRLPQARQAVSPRQEPGRQEGRGAVQAASRAAFDLLGDEDKRKKFDAGEIDADGRETMRGYGRRQSVRRRRRLSARRFPPAAPSSRTSISATSWARCSAAAARGAPAAASTSTSAATTSARRSRSASRRPSTAPSGGSPSPTAARWRSPSRRARPTARCCA